MITRPGGRSHVPMQFANIGSCFRLFWSAPPSLESGFVKMFIPEKSRTERPTNKVPPSASHAITTDRAPSPSRRARSPPRDSLNKPLFVLGALVAVVAAFVAGLLARGPPPAPPPPPPAPEPTPFLPPRIRTMADEHTTIVVLGASGDLAFKKTFPALFNLFKNDLLPPSVELVGYARTKMNLEDFRTRVTSQIKLKKPGDETYVAKFKKLMTYVDGQYDQEDVRLNGFGSSLTKSV